MALVRLPVMDVQSNWDELFRDPAGEKFWISCRVSGAKTIQGRVCKPAQTVPSDGNFIVRDYKQYSMTVECPEVGLTTTFIPPRKTLQLHDKRLLCADVSESGGLGVCSAEDGRLWVWDPDDGETRRTLEGHVGDVYTCRFFPSGIVILSGGADLQLKIWSALDGSCPRTLVGHRRGITDTAIIDRGRNIISVSSDGTARLWDCGSGSCIATLATTECPINGCALTSNTAMAEKNTSQPQDPECGTNDKVLLLACEDKTLRCIDVRNREKVFSFNCGEVPVQSCIFVGEVQAVSGSEDGVVNILDLRNPQEALSSFSCGSSAVTSLVQVGNSKCLSGHADGSCIVWGTDVAHRRSVSKLTGTELDRITSVTTAVGRAYTTCRDGNLRMYSIADVVI